MDIPTIFNGNFFSTIKYNENLNIDDIKVKIADIASVNKDLISINNINPNKQLFEEIKREECIKFSIKLR